jgi:hypothetical protein
MDECDRRRTQLGSAATYRPIAAILVDDSLIGVAMIPKRLNSATIGSRQQRHDDYLGHKFTNLLSARRCSVTGRHDWQLPGAVMGVSWGDIHLLGA